MSSPVSLHRFTVSSSATLLRSVQRPSPNSRLRRAFSIAARSSPSLPRSFCATSEPGKMQNEEGQMMDLYIPRNSATNRLITAKDHASIQVNVGHLDASGVYTGQHTTFALCGFIRAQGDGDGALDRLWQKKREELKQ
ncbi:hypothetical protein Taro_030674 [Colocasia esculenta]|uniref:40S ribosomal protein S21 n=1 Tax=Colocasia esculenta TaxID=4460 RepID=A0A843VMZ4_COLES|nr:hypothetical protein [Colocasia esculenta]